MGATNGFDALFCGDRYSVGGLAVKKLKGRSERRWFGESDLDEVADLTSRVTGIDTSQENPVLLKERFTLQHWLQLRTPT
jgi:hypothetical protein